MSSTKAVDHIINRLSFSEFRDFNKLVLQINENQPSQEFALRYLNKAQEFLEKIFQEREKQLQNSEGKLVIENFYKA